MAKKVDTIDNMTLGKLMELKSAADMIAEHYANELTEYATMYSDATLNRMTIKENSKYKKRIKARNLSLKLTNKIEEIISKYYD